MHLFRNPSSLLINSLLLFLLFGMVSLPLVLLHVLNTLPGSQSSVAGLQDTAAQFVVLPNFFDFNDHVRFNPIQEGNEFRDEVTVTSFRGQIATYHKLYTVTNLTRQTITLRGILGGKPSPSDGYDKVIVTLSPGDTAHSAKLTRAAMINDVTLEVTDGSVGMFSDYVFIDEEQVPVVAVDGNTLLTDPIQQEHFENTPVYRNGIIVLGPQVLHSRSNDILLQPEQSVTVNIVVMGKKDIDTQTVTIPLYITTVE